MTENQKNPCVGQVCLTYLLNCISFDACTSANGRGHQAGGPGQPHSPCKRATMPEAGRFNPCQILLYLQRSVCPHGIHSGTGHLHELSGMAFTDIDRVLITFA